MDDKSLFSKPFSPLYQAILCLSLYGLILLFQFVWSLFSNQAYDREGVWVYSTSMMLFYIIMNVIFAFSATNNVRYYRDSVFSFVGFIVLTSLIGQAICGVSIFEVRTFSWITMVFVIVYLVFVTIVNLMRKIVEYALKQDKRLRNEE